MRYYIFLLGLIFYYAFGRAQTYTVCTLGLDKGLSNNNVVDVAQDKFGFLWFATEEGLNRFDGTGFQAFYKAQGLTGNELSSLLADNKDPILWIGTQREGLDAYNYAVGTFTYYHHQAKNPHSITGDDITHLDRAADGNLWISTYWDGLNYFNKNTGLSTPYNIKNVKHLVSNQIWCTADAGNGLVYIGHVDKGLSILNIKNRTAINFQANSYVPYSLPSNEVNSLLCDKEGFVWVGTSKGLVIYDPTHHHFIPLHDKGRLSRRISCIRQMADGRIWLGTELGGIAIIQTQGSVSSGRFKISYITEGIKSTNLSGSSVRCLSEDHFHNVWAGLYGDGVNFLSASPEMFHQIYYSAIPDLSHLTAKSALSLAFDNQGNLWVGSDGNGINIFNSNGQRIAAYPTEAGSSVQAIYRDSYGKLWLGSFFQGACIKTPEGKFSPIHFPSSQVDVREFYEDARHRMWISTSDGIYMADIRNGRIIKHYTLNNNLVRSIYVDSRQQIWAGTFGGGLMIYNSRMKLIKSFNTHRGFTSNTINKVFGDTQGQIWVATAEGLINFKHPESLNYKVYNDKNGLSNCHIKAITEDASHNLWVSTNRGISCLKAGTSHFINYSYKDNLPLGNFNANCTAISKNGLLYFGSTAGISWFSPRYVLSSRKAPKVFITDVTIFNSLSNPRDSIINLIGKENIVLDYKHSSFSIHFNIQNYAIANNVEYAYKVTGENGDWITTDQNEIRFHNLAHGTYKVLVKCRIRNQQWPAQYTSLDLDIEPPFYFAWWAKTIYLLLTLSIIYAGFNVYIRRIRLEYLYKSEKKQHEKEVELNNERIQFFSNITHELRTPLTLIMGPLDDILHHKDLPESLRKKITVMQRSTNRLSQLINKILDFRKTETNNRRLVVSKENIVTSIHNEILKYVELNTKKDVTIKFNATPPIINIYFDKEAINSIISNFMSNAIKYTDRGEIDVRISELKDQNQHYVDISVSDTGHGISPEALPHIFESYYQENGKHQMAGTGIGLALVKSLVTLHQGTISVKSELEKGSSFTIRLEADNMYPEAVHQDHADDRLSENTLLDEKEKESLEETDDNRKKTLLLVEDNEDIREYIKDYFKEQYHIMEAEDGKQGLEEAFLSLPDIIISDIMMPNMDGNELCHILKNDIRTSHIPVILLTAKTSIEDKEEGYREGADSYLTKPFTCSLLESRIDNIINQRQRIAAFFKGKAGPDLDEKRKAMAESMNKKDKEFFKNINSLIDKQISEDIDINYLAKGMNMSASTLYRKMKATTGISTNEYLRKYKIHYAEKLLLNNQYTISEVSFIIGMNSIAYFRKCFKDEFGTSPSEYIKKIKQE